MSETKPSKKNALLGFFQASLQEIRKVTWPTRQQAVKMTVLVISFCLVAALVLGALDFVFNMGYRKLVEISPAGSQQSLLDQIPVGDTAPTTVTGDEVKVGDVSATDVNGQPVTVTPAATTVTPAVQPSGTQQ